MKSITLFFLFCLFLGSCQNTHKLNSDTEAIKVEDLKAKINEKDYTLVYFWTTWCGPCRKAIQETLPEIEQTFDASRVQLLTIVVSNDDVKINEILHPSTLKAKKYKLEFIGPDIYFNHKRALENTLEYLFPKQKVWNNGVPVFALVTKEGKVLNSKLPKDVEILTAILRKEGVTKNAASITLADN